MDFFDRTLDYHRLPFFFWEDGGIMVRLYCVFMNAAHKDAVRYLRSEFRNLWFASVVKITIKDDYFHGYAVSQNAEFKTRHSKMIWFQRNNHIKKPIHIGPIWWSQPVPDDEKTIPREGDIIFGQIKEAKKGSMFSWWSVQGYPLLKFSELLRYKRCRKKSLARVYNNLVFYRPNHPFRCQQCKYPREVSKRSFQV